MSENVTVWGVVCPNCKDQLQGEKHNRKRRCIDSRFNPLGVRRRYVCQNCKHRFTTQECLVNESEESAKDEQIRVMREQINALRTVVELFGKEKM